MLSNFPIFLQMFQGQRAAIVNVREVMELHDKFFEALWKRGKHIFFSNSTAKQDPREFQVLE